MGTILPGFRTEIVCSCLPPALFQTAHAVNSPSITRALSADYQTIFSLNPVHPQCIDAVEATPHSRVHRATRGGGDDEQD